jgi:hypothetical protein
VSPAAGNSGLGHQPGARCDSFLLALTVTVTTATFTVKLKVSSYTQVHIHALGTCPARLPHVELG